MSGLRIWQAMPQGWIEFAAQGESEQQAWWDDYLRSGEGWLTDEVRDGLTTGYRAGCDFFRDKDFDFAGIAIGLGESPFVSVMCTKVLTDDGEQARTLSRGLHVLLPAVRFGEDPSPSSPKTVAPVPSPRRSSARARCRPSWRSVRSPSPTTGATSSSSASAPTRRCAITSPCTPPSRCPPRNWSPRALDLHQQPDRPRQT